MMFLNVIMLAGIGGAVVPLVLHLLNRARYRSVDWAAMMFLDVSNARQHQSNRLKQWLMLLIRMALVGLLAITLARPLANANWTIGGQTPALAVIILDRSASMDYQVAGKSRVDISREAVRQILATLRRGDEAALIVLGDSSSAPQPHPTTDLQSINDALAAGRYAVAGSGQCNIADALKLAADVFDRSRSTNRSLFIVTDRQAGNWDQIDEHYATSWRRRMTIPGPEPRMIVIPVGGDQCDNIAIESLNVLAPQVIAKQPVDVEITVHNYGLASQPAVPLTLLLGQRVLHSTSVSVAARASSVTRMPIRADEVGPRLLVAQIESTGLKRDAILSAAVDVSNPINVLLIDGDMPHGTDAGVVVSGYRTQGDYLSLALMPFKKIGRDGADVAVVDRVPADDFSDIDSHKYRVVILANVARLSVPQARALEQHVYGGGGLLIAPGRLTRVDNLNEMLYRNGAGICPAPLSPVTAADGTSATSILGLDLQHPIFRFLKGSPDPIPRAVIGRYFPATVQQDDAHVLASFANGKPFLLQGDYGRGHVLLCTSPLDADWNTLPSTNFYLPMVQLAVRYLAARPIRNIHPGEIMVADFAAAGQVDLTLPDGTHPQGYPRQTNQPATVRYTQTQEPGVYWFTFTRQDDHTRTQVPFVVMPSHRESDLTPLTSQQWNQLTDWLKFTRVELDKTALSSVVRPSSARRELWPMLLTAVFALSMLESYLARRFTSPLQAKPAAAPVPDMRGAQAVLQ